VFNIQPGQGLGFTANKEIALGLGTTTLLEIIILRVVRFGLHITKCVRFTVEY
jgi:hypothetical protein